jgi:hypothetical protein
VSGRALTSVGLIACVAAAACALAQEPVSQRVVSGPLAVVLEVDRSEITVAQRIMLSISAEVADGARFEMPVVGDDAGGPRPKLGGWAIIRSEDDAPRSAGGAIVHRRRVILEPFLAGEYKIPPMEFAYRARGTSERGVVRTAPMTVRVASVLGDAPGDASKPDLGEPLGTVAFPEAPRSGSSVWWWVAGVGAAAILAAIGWRARRHRPVVSELELAIRDVEAFASARPGDESPAAYDLIARSLRRALADRLDPAASGMTSEELIVLAERSGSLDDSAKRRLATVLQRADAARYAGMSSASAGDSLETVLTILRSLRAPVAGSGGAS